MIELKNDFLKVNLHPKGAEIISITGVQDGLNYMWRRDPVQWANSAPILFPIVGAVRQDYYKIGQQQYHMTQHGFARHNEFMVHQKDDCEVTFTLVSNDQIKEQYPYEFLLSVTYTLKENQLNCHIQINNTDHQDIYFQVGGHPAFACPLMDNESSNDYYIEFSENENAGRKIIDVAKRGMSHEVEPFFENEKRFFVRQELFNRDAIVIQNFKSENIALRSLNHQKSLVFHMNGFDHVGIWAAKHVGGLIAIEPWVGNADYVDFNGDFKDKQSCVELAPQDSFECEFSIEINQ